MKIVIVEDEQYTAKDLIRTIQSIDSTIEVVEVIPSVEEGISFFSTSPRIDLIFSDIQLGDGQSFDIYDAVEITCPIIYCTAYDDYALKAFKTLGIDYILKPFDQKSVQQALDKYSLIKGKEVEPQLDTSDVISLLRKQLTPIPKSLLIRQGDKILPLPVSDIALFFIHHDMVFAYTFAKEKKAVSHKLNSLEDIFSESFFRTSRQHLVSRKAIKEASQYFNRKLKVSLNLDFPEEIIVGKLKVTAFLDWLTKT